MNKGLITLLAAIFFMARAAFAQDITYIQIEAQPGLNRAEQRARDYSAVLQDVNGFSLGAGWYGIALGPYSRDDAVRYMRELRNAGAIPNDSYIAGLSEYQSQFWPIGATLPTVNAPTPVVPDPEPETVPQSQEPVQAVIVPQPEPEPVVPQVEPDETPREAQRSEARLNRDERKDLQIALKWAGFYNAAIDGAFGRGTRRSMGDWQDANGFEVTGILTTRQRTELLRQYNSVLDGMDLRLVNENRAGISMQLPMGVVAFDKYEAPFVHFKSTGNLGAKVLLISQPGDQNTMFGLYEIMQTLEIVPLEGPRERKRNSFTLTGENAKIVSFTEVKLDGGKLKGFTLIWPAGDEERRTRVLDIMRKSFATTSAVLDPAAMTDGGQAIDLVSGLQIRKPRLSRSGFYVSRSGSVVTALEAVQNCGRITLDELYEATISATDQEAGIALLRPSTSLAPMNVAAFSSVPPRLKSEVAVAGYSYEGMLGAPTLTYGTIADNRGLQGETNLARLTLASLPGDVGGPVLDTTGAVIGMLLPRLTNGRVLPQDVSFSTNADTIRSLLRSAGADSNAANSNGAKAPEDLINLASGMTVLVSCWE